MNYIRGIRAGYLQSSTGRGGPWGCEISRLPHFLDSRLTDGSEVFSLTRRPPFTSRKIPGTHLLDAVSTPGAIVRLEVLGQLKNLMTTSGTFRLVA
jgi:hypothetical protein